MTKNILFILLFAATAGKLAAQQPAQYSLFALNPYNYNTAYAGLDGSLSATGVFRKQWVSFAGSPLTFQANVHLPVPFLRSGFGLAAEHDRLGAQANTHLRASYNYFIPIKEGTLSIGVGGTWLQKTIDADLLRTPDGNYEGGSIDHNDQLLSAGRSVGATFGLEAGIYYKHPRFAIGIAGTHLNAPVSTLAGQGLTTKILYRRAFSLQAQYNWEINADWLLQPNFLLKTDFVRYQPELAMILKYQQRFFGGVGYRGYDGLSQDAVIVLAGMQINKNMLLAYSYDISINALRTYNSGSHEVVFNYNLQKLLGKEIPQKIIYNPRFL